jgi:excisionase family DNA binding protein
MQSDKTLTPREAAVRLGCGMKRLYDLLYSQKIAATKRKGRWQIASETIEARLKERNSHNG